MAKPAWVNQVLSDVVFKIDSFKNEQLDIESWRIDRGQSWCVVGQNGAGKQFVYQLLTGELPLATGEHGMYFNPDEKIRGISFENQQRIYEQELRLAANDLLAEEDTATYAKDFLPENQREHPLIDLLNLRHRLDAPYSLLSTGESRKLLIAQAILEGATCLILDNPFDSLDVESCQRLTAALKRVVDDGLTIVFMISNRSDVPAWCRQLATVAAGKVKAHGGLDASKIQSLLGELFATAPQPDWPDTAMPLDDYPHRFLIDIPGATVRYGDNTVLSEQPLQVKPLEHTLITGSNGSGKSTLLGLVTGDNPQCYSNAVEILGVKRGSGESIWELKQDMGIVSNDLHRRYRIRCNALTVVCSGFFNSIGVYDAVSEHQTRIARQWLIAADLKGYDKAPFQHLSYGEQRLVLIARALVKSPLLLILDEPTQGLDETNRSRVLNLMDTLDKRRHTTLLFVSHRLDERLPLFRQHIDLDDR